MRRRRLVACLVVAVLLAISRAGAQQPSPPAAAPSDAEIAGAVAAVNADPNIAATRKIKALRFKDSTTDTNRPWWVDWFAGFASWLNQSTRVLAWAIILAFLAVVAAVFARIVRTQGASQPLTAGAVAAPTHVQDLDIRPETLPADIGLAARQLWDGGEHRAALALLYRGLLSRLAHVHQMPIRDSSTEGDCLAFSSRHLPLSRYEYVSRLVGVWQRAVYGHEGADTSAVHALCDGFSGALDTAMDVTR